MTTLFTDLPRSRVEWSATPIYKIQGEAERDLDLPSLVISSGVNRSTYLLLMINGAPGRIRTRYPLLRTYPCLSAVLLKPEPSHFLFTYRLEYGYSPGGKAGPFILS